MRRGEGGPVDEGRGRTGNDPVKKMHTEDVIPSPWHAQRAIHFLHRFSSANRSFMIPHSTFTFICLVNPVPLQRHADLFSWCSCLRWFTHRETPWRERAESQHCLTEPFAWPLSEVHLRAPSLLCEVKSRDKSSEFKQMESLLLLYSFASSFAWHVNYLDKISAVFLQITSVGQNSASWPKTFLHWPWAVFCSGGTHVSASCSWAVL